ncbi:hypothetical protein GWI33_022945 [Rhynchophorus ferrugineus]|uniref:Uncharacterized protein n=1 Tax=Rhynchophorus ferrugineus TaxID=354439 RepID=A0A834MH54_RHYFE|nr:hypothetical protein GWI33_022945 [Rhynchophorus ferrugineus]
MFLTEKIALFQHDNEGLNQRNRGAENLWKVFMFFCGVGNICLEILSYKENLLFKLDASIGDGRKKPNLRGGEATAEKEEPRRRERGMGPAHHLCEMFYVIIGTE